MHDKSACYVRLYMRHCQFLRYALSISKFLLLRGGYHLCAIVSFVKQPYLKMPVSAAAAEIFSIPLSTSKREAVGYCTITSSRPKQRLPPFVSISQG